RFFLVADSTSDMPAGSGAMAGLNWELDRDGLAADLGFARPHPNSLDAVSNRDFALDYLYAASVCAMHLSRLGSEIVIWSSQEFGFCEPADSFASGSSIMPQKKNPDAAELLRGKAPRVAASLASLLGTMHALPLAYSKDMQEDKQPLFDAIDTLEVCLEAADVMLGGLSFDRERLKRASEDEFLAATDLADVLVEQGMPFREAHGVVAGLVRSAVDSGKRLSELDDAEMNGVPEDARERLRGALRDGGTLEAKVSAGGTSSARVAEQLELARQVLADLGA
ncbi:MAG: argininosuccinate lyase, partial [Actinomycetota bacterium]|nr:argininosuccinate lyase [Actinomycetota bacterium]